MSIWMNLKVQTKTMVLVALATLSLVLMMATGLVKMHHMAGNEEDMSTAVRHVALLNDLKFSLSAIRLNLVYMMVLEAPDRLKEKAADTAKRRQAIEEGIAKFQKEDLSTKEKELIGAFSQGIADYWKEAAKLEQMTIASAGIPQKRAEAVKFATETVAPLGAKPVQAIADLVKMNVDEAAKTYQEDLANYQRSRVVLIVLAAIAGLFMVIIGTLIAKSISTPLKMVFDTLAQVADGDLTARSGIKSRDEMGLLAGEVNEMAGRLQGIMEQVARNSVEVAAAAGELQNTAQHIATSAEELAAQAGTVATASEEMAATSSEIAINCQHAADSSDIANHSAEGGARVVQQTVQVMERIADQVRTSAGTVAGLGERSDQIGEIVATIQDIADQTNLLALNAAIEAARAGEQGRGFAVVADEVRALAERTARATSQVSQMIGAIQSETRQAVNSMEAGVREVENGTREAAKSGDSLKEILNQINEVTLQVSQIATSAEEQTATTGEITQNLQQITEVVHETSRGAQTSAGAASELARLADELHALVGQFKLA
ncbi:methyl-accepting chemotaxis protein [Geomonas silvestris]|uniref:Methyl-accepting chemotaxis protein n=1 Tax=Geomonas silvestris TaxID=2740184 RepID=A0A6V8MN71_9BACT|nr:methyl-accepting chemotaxis protein [Geomonas silvestris]GFO61384.1 methyl-accepting chemotaxis protein [Geomonas silvestris]